MADLAAQHGLPLMTFRLGYATFHGETGVSADYQWWGRLVKTCMALGTVPDLEDLREGLTSVDYMTKALAWISRNPAALGRKFNLINSPEANLTLREFSRGWNATSACGSGSCRSANGAMRGRPISTHRSIRY